MSDRYRAVGRAVGRDGVGTVAIAKHTVDADAFASELNRLLDERDEAREEVRLLREEVAIADRGAEHPDAAAWREQVGTPCGVLDDGSLLARVPEGGECPDGWEWFSWDRQRWDRTVGWAAGAVALVRRIPAPPVEVGQWRMWREGRVFVVGPRPDGLWLVQRMWMGDSYDAIGIFAADDIARWPLCDPDPRWETTDG